MNRVKTLARTICPTVREGDGRHVVDLAARDAFGDLLRGQALGGGHGARYRTPGGVSLGPPPLVELTERLVLVERAALEAELHQVIERATHLGPRRDPEVLHHLTAVERGTHRVEVLLLGQARDPFLQVVLQRLELLRLERGSASCSRRG